MFVDFNKISDHSRIWIYSCESKITDDQYLYINTQLFTFLNSWQHHGKNLFCSNKIFNKRFIIIALDEDLNSVGGCAMDKLQALIIHFENELKISLLNRLNLFLINKEDLKCISLSKIKDDKTINMDSLFYDLTITKKEHINSWIKRVGDGWCSSYL